MEERIREIFSLFSEDIALRAQCIDTSRGDDDFRVTFIIDTASANKYVLKLADNDFTFPEKISVWQRTVKEYQRLGYYCPEIFCDRAGEFPVVEYRGHKCIAYGEEYAPFHPLEDRFSKEDAEFEQLYSNYMPDIWKMTSRIAELHLDYTGYPSGYCLFETFCPSDQSDEVLENALVWKEYADTLADEHQEQTERIWNLWWDNRNQLEKIYKDLPTSVFQADLNASNILLDEEGRFVGIYDFNLCGKDVFLNYLIRENSNSEEIAKALQIASEYYHFSDMEKDSVLMLYRCLKPLWYSRVRELKEAGDDHDLITKCLDETERMLVSPIDFVQYMG